MCTAMSVNGGDCGFEGGSSGSSESGAGRRKEQEQSDGNMRYEHYVLFAFLPSEGDHRQGEEEGSTSKTRQSCCRQLPRVGTYTWQCFDGKQHWTSPSRFSNYDQRE